MDDFSMSEEHQREVTKSQSYHIVIAGELDPSWSEWLGGLQVRSGYDQEGKSITTLSGELPDQTALRGILNKIWDLHLTLFSIIRVHESTE